MTGFASRADLVAIEAEAAWKDRDVAKTMHEFLDRARRAHGPRPAITYRLFADPKTGAETLTWQQLHAQVCQAANLFRSLGVGRQDVVAFVLPNALETAVTLLGGAVAGIVNPINPLLEPEQIAAILRETKAKVVVTLKAFPKSDVAQKVGAALAEAPGVTTVIEVDLLRYLAPPKRWIVPFLRPKNPAAHGARVMDFAKAIAAQPAELTFDDPPEDRVAAYFHTGGTTGMPKVAQHKVSGMVYNGWIGQRLLFRPDDVVMCPLPLFHVFAVYPILMSMIASGAQIVLPTPAGYRGDGVFDNLWKLIEKHRASYLVTVPTALAALMQRKIDADVSSLRSAFSGSAPLPVELFNRFEKATGVQVIEGYGLTECTCLVSVNPPGGAKKIGSVGLPFPHTEVRILNGERVCDVDEVGEICVSNPGVFEGSTYTELDKNRGLFSGRFLHTGDLGRIDADGYLFITGRAKDLIIRGGHNIDPAQIEAALMEHPSVAFVGAIGQPDSHSGELPCAYVELVAGAEVGATELIDFARARISERAAVPKHVEVLDALPKTAVGKVFKPDLRRMAIKRVYDAALAEAGLQSRVTGVVEDKKLGLVAMLAPKAEDARVQEALRCFTRPWDWAGEAKGSASP
ncbi:acyl-CoA synthetase [Falsirhodobacter xinxiangensis]|uniref:acyl-CoA synthetase n=1 Tax=Falsirhodobacter xinxiangensis TaxID=2530049 RepID=UPI0010A9EE9E|nr:acyl-CoA synthetase [Rhodobacter xinxiangensis]